MTYPLVSPGTSVTVNDESMYASAGEGTVPLFIIGTHEYKTLPSGTGIATGTLPENANKLIPVTSQRELLQTFGNPIFYTKNGTGVHGYELNEFGLHAAYQYLGIANRAYVIRGAIDYSQLAPLATAPVGDPANGAHWLDTATNTWGFYEWTGSEWATRTLHIVDSAALVDNLATPEVTGIYPPKVTVGAVGDLALVTTYQKMGLYQKLMEGGSPAWVLVGEDRWATIKPSASLTYSTYLQASGAVGDILVKVTPVVAPSLSAAATWTLKTYNALTGIWEESLLPIRALANEANLTKANGAAYVAFENDKATFTVRVCDGTNWTNMVLSAGNTEPSTVPVEGTLWYNPKDLKVEIKVNVGGVWTAYSTRYANTDTNGVILRGSAPSTQSNGSPLVNDDLWLDTSDLENFPVIYRRTNSQWKKINVEDQIDPVNGMVFGELADMTANHYEEDMKLWNLTVSTNTVKQYVGGQWVTASGFQHNGVPFFGRKAQRQMVITALAEAISSNEDIRAETLHFNLIAAPGYIELIDEMVTLNTDIKEVAFIVGDTPARLAPTGAALTKFAKPELSGTVGNSEIGVATMNPYVGMYYPWGLSTNVDGTEIMVPPSTLAMRTLAYNDSVAYPWMAPAGFTRGLVTNASSVGYLTEEGEFKAAILNQGQRDTLYINGINPIAYIPNRGLVVYGQKTRHNLDTSLNRINVARLINYLRFNLDNISKPFLFEPNDFQTREAVKVLFERYLGDLVGLRGLYDFIVVCDESNNTPERIDRHELWVDVAIQPVQAIEFIYIPVRILATGDDLDAAFL